MRRGGDGTSLHGRPARYPTGLVDIAPGVAACLRPNGDSSESDAGLTAFAERFPVA